MKNSCNIAGLVAQYDPLLCRYARRLLRNASAAPFLIQRVFESFYEQYELNAPSQPRKALAILTRQQCEQFLLDPSFHTNRFNQANQPNHTNHSSDNIAAFDKLFAKKPKNPV